MQSFDPVTGGLPDDTMGFLFPIDSTGYQIGWVDYEIDPVAGLSSGTQITNQAFVNFDSLPACDTCPFWSPAPKEQPWLNTIDATPPSSYVYHDLQKSDSANFMLRWAGEDSSGSGVKSYSIYYSREPNSDYQLWLENTTADSGFFTGSLDSTYYFYSIATDNVGNIEAPPDSFDCWITMQYICGDVNGNGYPEPDISDLTYLVAYLFLGGPPPLFMESADVNCLDDPLIPDISDLVYLVAYMFLGGPDLNCPPCEGVLAKPSGIHEGGTCDVAVRHISDDQFCLSATAEFNRDIAGFQQEYWYDTLAVLVDSVVPASQHGVALYSHAEGGALPVGLLDIKGKRYFSAGKVDLFEVYFHTRDGVSFERRHLDLKFTKAADRSARPTFISSEYRYNPALPTRFALHQNYPNPFNAATIVKYDLPKAADVRISIFNVLGQRVKTLMDEKQEAGFHEIRWDATNDQGGTVASGVYFYRIEADDFTKSKKMLLLK
jgi:hypothetical protein